MCNQRSVKEKLLWGILGFPLCHLTQLMHVVIIMRNFVAVMTVCSLMLDISRCWTSVGSTSLSSGVTIKLIREVAENAHTFSSAEDIEKRLPIFSQSHAISMWNIVKQFLQKV